VINRGGLAAFTEAAAEGEFESHKYKEKNGTREPLRPEAAAAL
jgi:hypothetical protein